MIWREVGQRPRLEASIIRTHRSTWECFKRHHYLSHSINPSAQCWACLCGGQPVAFVAVLSAPHPVRSFWRVSRLVCLPDYQGLGFAGVLLDYVAGIYRALGKPVAITSTHPGLIASLCKNHNWKTLRKPGVRTTRRTPGRVNNKTNYDADRRKTASFEFVGAPNREDCRRFGL